MLKSLFSTIGWNIVSSPKEKCFETINDFITKKESREGEKNYYGTLKIQGIPYLQFATINRELDQKNIDYLYQIAYDKFTNNSIVNFDGEIILATFVNTKEVYGIVIDGQHRLKALERLLDEGVLPEDFKINVIVHRITTYKDGFNLIKRWNKEAIIRQAQVYNSELLNELQKLETSKEHIFGKQRPKIILTDFIDKVKELELSVKISVEDLIIKMLKFNEELKIELGKTLKREKTIKEFCNEFVDGKNLSYNRLMKYSNSKYCFGLDTSVSYLKKII